MSDVWNPTDDTKEENGQPSQEPAVSQPQESVPAAEPVAPEPQTAPESPAAEPAQAPQTPPMNGWSSDGGYRYVPPRAPQNPSGGYQSPMGGNGSYYTQSSTHQSGYTPYGNVPPQPPAKPPRKGSGWVVALAVLGAAAVILCVTLGVLAGVDYLGRHKEGLGLDGGDASGVVDTSEPEVPENAPSLDITAWDNDDGGLTTKEIVKRNFDSTVLLTSYIQTNNFHFGESSLMEAGVSTGIIMTEDGYIVTNRHCVVNEDTGKPFDRVDVTLYNGKVYEDAQVVGSDASTDLAVIRVKATNLTVAKFGDSSELEVGDRVVALGNAAGLEWSASQGIISALARDVYEDTGYAIRCLQVDASINPGNSGGPLLNNQGLVVGINSAKIAATDYEGIGFTIPINEAKAIVDSLIKFGYVKGRVALGVNGQTVSSGMYQGFMITEILSTSDLNGKDAQSGDLIVAVDGVKVADYGTLRSELAKHKIGDTVELTLLRSDRRTGQVTTHKVKVKLSEQKQ